MAVTRFRRMDMRRTRIAMSFDMARIRFDELRDFCECNERWFTREQRDFRARVKGQMTLVDPNDQGAQSYIESLAEDLDQLETTFPNVFRTSLLIQSCSVFEHNLIRISRCYERAEAPKFLDYPKDTGIKKAQSFLKQVGTVDFPDQTETWADILKVFDVRNVATHANGTVPEKPKHPKQEKHKAHYDALKARWPDELELDRFRQMTFSAGFLPRVLELFEAFLHELRPRALAARDESEE